MTTVLQLAAQRTEPDHMLRLARGRHIIERSRGIGEHWEKFEHCADPLCAKARESSGLDQRQIDAFARSHGKREPGE